MKYTILLLAVVCLYKGVCGTEVKPKHLLGNAKAPEGYKYPFEVESKKDLPRNFTWGNVDGKNYLTRLRNQHIPQYCGSCWAHASTSMMSDRISILRGGAFPEINIAPQTLLDFDYNDQGCHGGDYRPAFEYIAKSSIVDEACSQYRARGWEETEGNANVQPRCKDCADGKCFVPENHNEYTVDHHGEIPFSEEAIMTEIYRRGPVGCGVWSDPLEDIEYGFTGVFETTKTGETGHAINVVGWGVEEGTGKPYWVMRNSWGEYFADGGYVKVFRGNNTLNIEDSCYYAVPKKTWADQTYPNTGEAERKTNFKVTDLKSSLETEVSEEQEVAKKVTEFGSFKGSYNKSELKAEHIVNTLPQDFVKEDHLPARFWWGDVDGVNYLSWNVNQHIPQYCGSCWAQASVGAMSDRINIMHKNIDRRFLSTQVLINCGVGDCVKGGDANVAYNWIYKNGLPEYACQNYIAKNAENPTCSNMQKCMNCPFFGEGPCTEVRKYTAWKAKEFGRVKGALNMKKELWARGPLACSIAADDKFYYGYKGGIYSTTTKDESDHVITVTGWGKTDEGQEFWIVRNSWGTYWGENGYYRVTMYENNARIEEDCDWIVPEETVVDLDAEPKMEKYEALDN